MRVLRDRQSDNHYSVEDLREHPLAILIFFYVMYNVALEMSKVTD